jgi:hypothetical protein
MEKKTHIDIDEDIAGIYRQLSNKLGRSVSEIANIVLRAGVEVNILSSIKFNVQGKEINSIKSEKLKLSKIDEKNMV